MRIISLLFLATIAGLLTGGCSDEPDCRGGVCEETECENGEPIRFHVDADGDGYGGEQTVLGCRPGDGRVTEVGDCDDQTDAVFPDAREICNGVDDDCDGEVDDGCADPVDDDGDGFCAALPSGSQTPQGCDPSGEDCDDTDPAVFPGADESGCPARDLNCDGTVAAPTVEWETLTNIETSVAETSVAAGDVRAAVAWVERADEFDTARVVLVDRGGSLQTDVVDLTESELAGDIEVVRSPDGYTVLHSVWNESTRRWDIRSTRFDADLQVTDGPETILSRGRPGIRVIEGPAQPWVVVRDGPDFAVIGVETGDEFTAPRFEGDRLQSFFYAHSQGGFGFLWTRDVAEDDDRARIVVVDDTGASLLASEEFALTDGIDFRDIVATDNGQNLLLLLENDGVFGSGVVDPEMGFVDFQVHAAGAMIYELDAIPSEGTIGAYIRHENGGDALVVLNAMREASVARFNLGNVDLERRGGLARVNGSWGILARGKTTPLEWVEAVRGDETPLNHAPIVVDSTEPALLRNDWSDVRYADGSYQFLQRNAETEEAEWIERASDGTLSMRRTFPARQGCGTTYLWEGNDVVCYDTDGEDGCGGSGDYLKHRFGAMADAWEEEFRLTVPNGEDDEGNCSSPIPLQWTTLADGRPIGLFRRPSPAGPDAYDLVLAGPNTGATVVATSTEGELVVSGELEATDTTTALLVRRRQADDDSVRWLELYILDDDASALARLPVAVSDRGRLAAADDRFLVAFGDDATRVATIPADASGVRSTTLVDSVGDAHLVARIGETWALWSATDDRVLLTGFDDAGDPTYRTEVNRGFLFEDVALRSGFTDDAGADVLVRGEMPRAFLLTATCFAN